MAHDLDRLLAQLDNNKSKMPPVHLWQPERTGEIDITIDEQGDWFHEGGIFERKALMQLFASILRFEGGQYYLVTPVERLKITVADVPFIIDAIKQSDQGLQLISQCDDVIKLDSECGWQLRPYQDVVVPYVCVRHELYARLSRNVFYQLVEIAMEQDLALENGELMLASFGSKLSLGKVE